MCVSIEVYITITCIPVSRVDITRAAHGCFLLTHDAPLPNRPTAYNTSDDVLDMIEGAGLPSHPMHEYFWHIESETSVDDGVSADSSNDSARLRGDNDQDDNVWIALCFKYDYGSPCDGSEMALNWTRTIDAFYQRAQALVTQPHALMRPGATSNDRDGQLISPRTKEHGDTEIIIYSDSGSGLIAEDVEIREEIIQNLRAGKKNAKDRNSYFTQHESYLYDKMSVSGEEKEGPEAEEMRGIGGKGRARLRRKPFVLQGAMNSGRLIGRSRCKARFTLDGAATPTGNACLAQRWRPWVAGFCVNRYAR